MCVHVYMYLEIYILKTSNQMPIILIFKCWDYIYFFFSIFYHFTLNEHEQVYNFKINREASTEITN